MNAEDWYCGTSENTGYKLSVVAAIKSFHWRQGFKTMSAKIHSRRVYSVLSWINAKKLIYVERYLVLDCSTQPTDYNTHLSNLSLFILSFRFSYPRLWVIFTAFYTWSPSLSRRVSLPPLKTADHLAVPIAHTRSCLVRTIQAFIKRQDSRQEAYS